MIFLHCPLLERHVVLWDFGSWVPENSSKAGRKEKHFLFIDYFTTVKALLAILSRVKLDLFPPNKLSLSTVYLQFIRSSWPVFFFFPVLFFPPLILLKTVNNCQIFFLVVILQADVWSPSLRQLTMSQGWRLISVLRTKL